MTGAKKDLVVRLRDRSGRMLVSETTEEAAAEIERLREEVGRWKDAYDIAHDQATENGGRIPR